MNFSTSPPNRRVISGAAVPQYASSAFRDLGRRRALREAGEADEVGEEDTHLLVPGPRRRQVQPPEPLVAQLAPHCEADDHVRRDDQAVPLPPARVPLALASDRYADHRLGQEEEAGDNRDREQVPSVAEDACVTHGADRVHERPAHRDGGDEPARRGLGIRPLQWRDVRHRPGEPDDHRGEHRDPEERAATNEPRSEPGPDVHERRARREHRAHEQPDRDRDLEASMLLREEDRRRADRVEPHEAAGGHECE
jgi:hypothetical protein